jgi:pimeloyl-ACP methyl ester carboxylesterase
VGGDFLFCHKTLIFASKKMVDWNKYINIFKSVYDYESNTNFEEALQAVKDAGANPIPAILAIGQTLKLTIPESTKLVMDSIAFQAEKQPFYDFQDKLHEVWQEIERHESMNPIYLISGLGADYRVFQNIDFKHFTPVHIQWIAPQENETMKSYATRLTDQIYVQNPIIIGVSFGGMLAVEISQLIDCKQVIIISSAKTRDDIPLFYRFLMGLGIHKLLPISWLKWMNPFTYWMFGIKTKEEKMLLKGIINDTDPQFLFWAIDAILKWDNKVIPDNLVHIHGENDKMLPISSNTKVNFRIKDGGHLMVYNRAGEIGDLLSKIVFKMNNVNS